MVTPKAGQQEGQTGTVPPEGTPGKGEQPPPSTDKTITQAHYDEGIATAKREAGREGRAAATKYLSKETQAFDERVVAEQTARAAAEQEAGKSHTEASSALKSDQDARVLLVEAKARNSEADAKEAASRHTNVVVAIYGVAHEFKVDSVKLKDELKDIGVTDPEQLKRVAKAVAKSMASSKGSTPEHDDGVTQGPEGFTRDPKNPDETLKRGFQDKNKK